MKENTSKYFQDQEIIKKEEKLEKCFKLDINNMGRNLNLSRMMMMMIMTMTTMAMMIKGNLVISLCHIYQSQPGSADGWQVSNMRPKVTNWI